jgi:hypothetical protein
MDTMATAIIAPMPKRVRRLTVDLHGHDVVTALELAIVRVAEAHRNGYEEIELVHGAADVEEPVEEGRGRIKWELRRLARSGRFHQWTEPDRTWEKAGSLILHLRPNPPSRPQGWSRVPPQRHTP